MYVENQQSRCCVTHVSVFLNYDELVASIVITLNP